MSYYDSNVHTARGIDWDLWACLSENPQDFTVDDIAQTLAVFEGENEEEDWRWILRLNDGQFVALQGGCDYTGWDCQSSASSTRYPTIAEALGHFKDQTDVWASLDRQLAGAKDQTWHERTAQEFKDVI
jgi:hypothetical protein